MSTRTRFGSVVEWAVAAACIVAALAVGSAALREIRTLRAATAVNAEARAPLAPPAVVAPRSVSVPVLVMSDGARLHVGEGAAAISGKMETAWQVGGDAIERGANGDRVTRSYYDGARFFQLVLEPPAVNAEARIVAIYLQ
jgi:hypothetical protein